MTFNSLQYFILILKMNDPQLVTITQGVLIEECDCFTINCFDVAKLKSERVKAEMATCNNFVHCDSQKD